MYFLVVFLPLISFIFIFLCSNVVGRKGSSFLAIFNMFVSLCFTFLIFYEVGICGSICILPLIPWLNLGIFDLNWCLFFDELTSVLLMLVIFISFLVHFYSYEYMGHDPCLPRFMGYISLFTFCMLFLVTSYSFLQMFVGWEAVGLTSYLLINFWFTRVLANKAGLKAMVLNRIGDFGLMLAITAIFYFFGSLVYTLVFSLSFYYLDKCFLFGDLNINILSFISFWIFVGAVGKSAQLGLHSWLSSAMNGPTPVSALIHAATMVTAGVFVIIRCSFLFEYASNILVFVTIIGSLTCCLFAIVGAFQYDLKSIIAYSTCSQLGYMVFSCGLSNYYTSIFHLFNHGFFKALLFLSAGAIIHALSEEQDIRRLGGLVNLLPFTYICIFIGSLAIVGFPFLSGFYSKEFLLEFAWARFDVLSLFAYKLGLFAALFTSIYSWKLLYWVFLAKSNIFKGYSGDIHEPGFFMVLPMVFLTIFSIFVGYTFSELFIGLGFFFWDNSIFLYYMHNYFFEVEQLSFNVRILPLFVTCLGFILFYLFNLNRNFFVPIYLLVLSNSFVSKFFKFFSKEFYFNFLYFLLLKRLYVFSYKQQIVDKGIFELFGPYVLYLFFYSFFKILRKFNFYGYFFDVILYVLYFFLFLLFIISSVKISSFFILYFIFLCVLSFSVLLVF